MIQDVETRVSDIAARRNKDIRSIIAIAKLLHKIDPWRLDRTRLEFVRRIDPILAGIELVIVVESALIGPRYRHP